MKQPKTQKTPREPLDFELVLSPNATSLTTWQHAYRFALRQKDFPAAREALQRAANVATEARTLLEGWLARASKQLAELEKFV